MIKRILKNSLIFLSVFIVATILFFPKQGLWFEFEKRAFEKELIIDSETISSNPIFLNVKNGHIYFSGMNIANFEEASILPLLFYNSIDIKKLVVGENMQQFKELSMDNLNISYSVAFPQKIILNGEGDFGILKGRVNFIKKTLDILIFPTENFKKVTVIMKHFKKLENGGYVYNARF
jgi:hypothetical protein